MDRRRNTTMWCGLRAGVWLALGMVVSLPAMARGADGTTQIQWFDSSGIDGQLVIVGGGEIPDAVREAFLQRAGGEDARLVVIPTAAERADELTDEQGAGPWHGAALAALSVLHTRDRETADGEEFVAPLRDATAVWISGGQQSRLAAAYQGTQVEQELQKLLERGGVIGGTSAGAAIMSRVMIASGNPKPNIQTGLDLLPGAIIDQHFTERNRLPRLQAAIAEHPGLFGVGIDEATAVVVDGRRMAVVGAGAATLVFAGTAAEEAEVQRVDAGTVLDLTSLRRRAQERVLPAFPPEHPSEPVVKQGSLVIVGGGRMPGEVTKRFIDLAGGSEAPIVILPTAVPPSPNFDADREAAFLRRAGAQHVSVLDARSREDVESPEFEAAIRQAGGLWFGGGRQWRFVDAYAGTKAEEWFREVLERGGVIGGSSAGASIQAEYLARGNPLGNLDIMAAGYERGFGYLPGAAVDQHFAQRRRFGDMTSLVDRYPQLLGIGIDEGTALIVQGGIGEVVGLGQVHFYDRRQPILTGYPDYDSAPAGSRYDLVGRSILPLAAPRP